MASSALARHVTQEQSSASLVRKMNLNLDSILGKGPIRQVWCIRYPQYCLVQVFPSLSMLESENSWWAQEVRKEWRSALRGMTQMTWSKYRDRYLWQLCKTKEFSFTGRWLATHCNYLPRNVCRSLRETESRVILSGSMTPKRAWARGAIIMEVFRLTPSHSGPSFICWQLHSEDPTELITLLNCKISGPNNLGMVRGVKSHRRIKSK